MKKGFQIFIGVAWIISAAACQAQAAPQSMDPTAGPEALATPIQEALASVQAQDQQSETGAPSTDGKLAEISARVGYTVREPAVLPDGYTLAEVSVDEPTRSVCLQYRHTEAQDVILLIAQGPKAGAPALAEVPGWPDYALTREAVELAGASQAERLLGWRRASWGCSGIAESTSSPYSFALAPRYSWEMGDQVFEIYSASGGCATTGGLTNLDLLRMAEGLTGQSALAADALDPECLMSIADAEKLAGFDIKEPTYLPQDVAFYYAVLETGPEAGVTLNFVHLQHKQMGRFFLISQFAKAPAYAATSCDPAAGDACEVVPVGELQVVYRFNDPTEQLEWMDGGLYFNLFRNAGEPGKRYKDELLKVIEGLK